MWILSGLCRTCEIFGVNSLVVSNSAVIDDAEFKALSMSAENWTNIEQVCFNSPRQKRICLTFSFSCNISLLRASLSVKNSLPIINFSLFSFR